MVEILQEKIKSEVPNGYRLVFSMSPERACQLGETDKEDRLKYDELFRAYQNARFFLGRYRGRNVFVTGVGRGYKQEGLKGKLDSVPGEDEVHFSVGGAQVKLFGLLSLAIEERSFA